MKEYYAVPDKTDEELVAMTLADQENFLFLVNRYKEKLFRYIRRLTNISAEDAEDILQEVFMKAYVNLNDFEQDLKFSSWIYRIAHNQVISHHRKIMVRPQGNAVNLEDSEVMNIAADLDTEKDIDIKILRQNIDMVASRLEPKYREVLILRYFEDKNYQEISDIIKRPLGTVASYLNKAKQEFRDEIEKQKIKF